MSRPREAAVTAVIAATRHATVAVEAEMAAAAAVAATGAAAVEGVDRPSNKVCFASCVAKKDILLSDASSASTLRSLDLHRRAHLQQPAPTVLTLIGTSTPVRPTTSLGNWRN
jgi:sugar (pentulose or hexulose) kinase